MSKPSNSIDRTGLDEAFSADEERKSKLMLEAQLLQESDDLEKGSELYAEAAAIEESLAKRCGDLGLEAKKHVHLYSAASGWARAGDFHHALSICKAPLNEVDKDEPLHNEVEEFTKTVRKQRIQWYSGVFLNSAA